MSSIFLITFLLALLPIAAAGQYNKMTYTVSECEEDETQLQTTTEVFHARPETEERLACSMGIGCNGRVWTSCGAFTTSNEVIRTLGGVYLSAASGDSARYAAGDFSDHITQFVVRDTAVHIRADRVVYYKLYHLGTGTLVFNDPRLARAGTMVAVSIAATEPGPHLLLAYDPNGDRVMGYRLFVR